jgi:hypothetical protein
LKVTSLKHIITKAVPKARLVDYAKEFDTVSSGVTEPNYANHGGRGAPRQDSLCVHVDVHSLWS